MKDFATGSSHNHHLGEMATESRRDSHDNFQNTMGPKMISHTHIVIIWELLRVVFPTFRLSINSSVFDRVKLIETLKIR